MENLALILIFIFGSIIGSFLNVVILRYNTGRNLDGRSKCPNCSKKLKWYELIPIFSWFFLLGKCSRCKSKISPQYPAVELITAILFIFLAQKAFGILPDQFSALVFLIFNFIIFSILIVIFFYDLRHKIIPDGLVYTLAIFAFIKAILISPNTLDLLSGLILAAPFAALWLISRGMWIGLGDAKLALGIGWYLGFVIGLNAIVLSFWIGAIFGLSLVLIDRLLNKGQNYRMKSEIPFGPFMIIATISQFFIPIDFIGITLLF